DAALLADELRRDVGVLAREAAFEEVGRLHHVIVDTDEDHVFEAHRVPSGRLPDVRVSIRPRPQRGDRSTGICRARARSGVSTLEYMALAECPTCGCTFEVHRRTPLATIVIEDDGTYVMERPRAIWRARRMVHHCSPDGNAGGDEAAVPARPLGPRPS